jgi:RimJ/RimL family protein N-acetyltransferase
MPHVRIRGGGYEQSSSLLRHQKFAQLGATRYTVAVYSSNAPAQAFYRRFGFRPVGEFSLYDRAWTRLELDLSNSDLPVAGPGKRQISGGGTDP